jgi:hypothetical protein
MVELRVGKDCLIISPDRRPRQGWDEAFQASGHTGDDELMLEATKHNEFDRKEWRW